MDKRSRPPAQNRRADPPARLGGHGEHGAGNVDAQHMSARTDLLRQRNGDGAAAATDIDDALARFGPGAADQDVGDRLEQDVLRLLPIGPALAAWSVPVGDLVGVSLVALRVFP